MFKILTLNKIADCGLEKLNKNLYEVTDNATEDADGVILRSFAMHDMEFPASLSAIARAGAGVNNIPVERCSEKGIVVFNTPGANANAVKELVLGALMLASRDIIGAIDWAKTLDGKGADVPKLVEKGKGEFVGPEIDGKKLGVIGLGAIGVMVANTAHHLGMNVIGYDPYLSVDSAWNVSRYIARSTNIKEIFEECDYITLHVPLVDDTRAMINTESINTMKDGVRILNFSRAELVNGADIVAACESGKVARYITDFPTQDVLNKKNVVAIPHLGASTPESEDNCAVMAAQELADFLENGNITNSVNFPNCSMPFASTSRVTIAHKNIPAMVSQFSNMFGESKLNIENMINKSKKNYAYTILDIDGTVDANIIQAIENIDGVLKVKLFK